MLFSSITFLYYFLPAVLLVYTVAPRSLKNPILLVASLVFYAWAGVQYAAIMVALIATGYAFGLLIERFREKPAKRWVLACALACPLAVLACFKYADFTLGSINYLMGSDFALLGLALPIGISFYTFQLISYLVDVYRGTPAQRNLLTLATYIAMFPQLVAGPIVRYNDIAAQLANRMQSLERFAQGGRRFIIGLAKKVLIANQMSLLCELFRATNDSSVLFCWMYAVAFALYIYFDFSGYSDMAIGLGKMLGFDYRENFNYPYLSRSVSEFWRRWHISLGTWFRDYVYIPLGGNRVSRSRWFFNVLVVWSLTGLWHGAAWNFLAWGLFFAALLLVEKFWLAPVLERHRALSHAYTLFAVLVSFVIFNANGLGGAVVDLTALFGLGGLPLISDEALYYLGSYGVLFICGFIGATPVVAKAARTCAERLETSNGGRIALAVLEPLLLVALLALSTAYLVDGSFNPFLYFRF